MARQVVRTLALTPGIAGVSVVTASPEVSAFAEREGAAVIWEERDAGTAEACRSAVAHLSTRVDSVLMISGDIPLISTEAVAGLLSSSHHPVTSGGRPRSLHQSRNVSDEGSYTKPAPAGAFPGSHPRGSPVPPSNAPTPPPAGGEKGPLVVIAPDRRRSGTNALLCTPPAIIPPCFGADSFQRHLAAARSQGVGVRIVESHALALDIDELEDLDELQRRLEANPTLLSAELREAVARRAEAPAQ